MLSDLNKMQETDDESVSRVNITFEVETRCSNTNELIEKIYKFAFAQGFDVWTFHEYIERRTEDTQTVSDRDWRQTEHIFWNDVTETPEIDVPANVADELARMTGSESVKIQVPTPSIEDNGKEVLYEVSS